MDSNQNRRFRETDERIAEKVYEIMIRENVPIDRVTVRKVCETAGINRSTFYAHFKDVYDVMEQVERDTSRRLTEEFLAQLDSGASMEQCFCRVFQFIGERRHFYTYYLHETKRVAAVGMDWEMMRDKLARLDLRELGCRNETEFAYRSDFFLAGVTAVIQRWLDAGCKETPREMSRMLARQYEMEKGVFD